MPHQDVITANISTESVNEEPDSTPCSYFDYLPPEVFDLIFSQFRLKTRLTYRLVCKSFDERITHSGTTVPLIIRDWLKDGEIVKRLEKCGFESINVKVWENFNEAINDSCLDDLNTKIYGLPPVVWEKIGSKIRELTLCFCRAGDQVMKEILLNCNNLQFLSVDLKNGVPAESFCSLSMLESLENVAPKNLREFEICIDLRNRKNFELAHHLEIWTCIFEAFFRLFPTLTRFSYASYEYSYLAKRHLCKFVREINQNEELKLATIMARLIFDSINDIMIAMNTLATLSLKKVEIKFKKKDFINDEEIFLNFFGRQKKLEVVHFTLYSFKVNRRGGDEEMLRAIFFKIVQSCPDLRELYFNSKEPHLPWLHDIREYTSNLKLQNLLISGIKFWPNSLEFSRSYKQCDQGHRVTSFFLKFAHITYLSIKCYISDELLQSVFQHMTNLKILELYSSNRITPFVIMGLQCSIFSLVLDGRPIIRYSINHLQNLERLSIERDQPFLNFDGIIPLIDDTLRNDELQLPRLHYLSCFPPWDLSLLTNFGISMPVLRTIKFSSGYISFEALVNLCQSTKNLHTLIIAESRFSNTEIEELFQICPSLQVVQCEHNNVTVKRKK